MGVGRLFCGQLLQRLPAFRQIVNGKWASGLNTETLNVLHRAWQYRYPHVTKDTDDKSSPKEKGGLIRSPFYVLIKQLMRWTNGQ